MNGLLNVDHEHDHVVECSRHIRTSRIFKAFIANTHLQTFHPPTYILLKLQDHLKTIEKKLILLNNLSIIMSAPFVYISGFPGVGKFTVAKELVSVLLLPS